MGVGGLNIEREWRNLAGEFASGVAGGFRVALRMMMMIILLSAYYKPRTVIITFTGLVDSINPYSDP